MKKLVGVMRVIVSMVIIVVGLSFVLANFFESSRLLPGNLNVFVVDTSDRPKEFYSSPHAYRLIQTGVPIAKMPLSRARSFNIPMAEDSKQDFSCWHNVVTWHLIDYGLWPNYCRWNDKGEWQNSEWPYLLEAFFIRKK